MTQTKNMEKATSQRAPYILIIIYLNIGKMNRVRGQPTMEANRVMAITGIRCHRVEQSIKVEGQRISKLVLVMLVQSIDGSSNQTGRLQRCLGMKEEQEQVEKVGSAIETFC